MSTWTPIWVARSSCTSSVQLRLIVCSESLPAGGPGSGVVIPTTVLASAGGHRQQPEGAAVHPRDVNGPRRASRTVGLAGVVLAVVVTVVTACEADGSAGSRAGRSSTPFLGDPGASSGEPSPDRAGEPVSDAASEPM